MNTIPFCDECKCANDAAKNGHIRCLKYLHKNRRPWDARACNAAAANGHIECLEYLHKNGCPCIHIVVLSRNIFYRVRS